MVGLCAVRTRWAGGWRALVITLMAAGHGAHYGVIDRRTIALKPEFAASRSWSQTVDVLAVATVEGTCFWLAESR